MSDYLMWRKELKDIADGYEFTEKEVITALIMMLFPPKHKVNGEYKRISSLLTWAKRTDYLLRYLNEEK
jgi:hypothetical protein